MQDDIFDDGAEIEESVTLETEEVKDIPENEEVSDYRPQMATAKVMEAMLANSAKLQDKQYQLDTQKLARQAEFLEYANNNGFSAKDICSLYSEAIAIAKRKQDSRALTRLTELVAKTMLEPANDMSKFFLSLQQTNIKMQGKNGIDAGLESATNQLNNLPDHVVKKFLAEKLEEIMKNG